MAPSESVQDGFYTLPILVAGTSSFPHDATHEIRLRRNAPRIPTADDSRSLFLKNIPVDSTEPHFRAVFTHLVGAGKFETMIFPESDASPLMLDPAQATKVSGFARKRKRSDLELEEKREEEAAQLPDIWTRKLCRSSSTAVVLLADEKSVQIALRAITKVHKTKKYPVWGAGVSPDVPSLGSAWVTSHLQASRANKAEVQTAVHAFFNVFNRKEKETAELAKRLRNEPDEDGFVTVMKGGRVVPASRNEAEEARQKMVDKQAKKKSEMKDFYRFQLRERRREEQKALLNRFQDDRRKVDAMRERRGKFKPET